MLYKTVIITGASKGYGRAVAKAFAKFIDGNLHFVLSGRDQMELDSLEKEIHTIRINKQHQTSCKIVVADISNNFELEDVAEGLFNQKFITSESVTFINNAGSLGPLSRVGSEYYTASEVSNVINLNITGCLYLTSEFVKRFVSYSIISACTINTLTFVVYYIFRMEAHDMASRPVAAVVNVSSLVAQVPAPAMSLYCAGKAARDMFHLVLAEEQRTKWKDSSAEASKEIRVLNYAPGPMDTSMQGIIRQAEAADHSLGTAYTDMKERGLLVDVDASAEKLWKILTTSGVFQSGAHVDYFDKIDGLS